MPFLVVAGVTVPVRLNAGTSRKREEIGERARAFNGTMRSTIRTTKRAWSLETTPILRATANTLETALLGAPPLSCSGDLLGGSVNCHAVVTGWQPAKKADGERVVLAFELLEA